MANLRDIRTRIKSVQNTQKITKAMKMVAAAKLRRAQEAAEASRPYAASLRRLLAAVGDSAGGGHPLLEPRVTDKPKIELVVLSADRGLCGAFNSNILKNSNRFANEHADVRISFVGRKAREFFGKSKHAIQDDFGGAEGITYEDAARVGDAVTARFESGEVDEVRVAFTRFHSPLRQEVLLPTLLPLGGGDATEGEESGPSLEYIFEPGQAQVLDALVPRYVKTSIFSMMLESNASEQGARMTAMDNASTNAAEMIGNLKLTYNRLRQAAITTELMEIIGGSEALKG